MPQNKNEETKKPSLFARIKQAILGSPKEIPEPAKLQAQKAVPQKKDNARSQNSEYGSVPAQVSEYGFMPSIGNEYGDVPDKSRTKKTAATTQRVMPSNANEYGDVPDKSSATKTASASPPPSNYAATPTASKPPSNYVATPSPTPPSNSSALAAATQGEPKAQPKTPHEPIKINELDAQFLETHTLPEVNYSNNNRSQIILENYGTVLGNMERAIANQDLAMVAQKMGASAPDSSAKLQKVDIYFEDSKDGKSAILSVSLRLGQAGKIGKDQVSNITKNFDLNNKSELSAFVEFLNQNAVTPTHQANNAPAQQGTTAAPPSNNAATPTASAASPPSNYAATPTASPPPSNYAATPTVSAASLPSNYAATPTASASSPRSNYSAPSTPSQQSTLSNAAAIYGSTNRPSAPIAGNTNYASMPSQPTATTASSVKPDKPPDVTASLAASLARILELKEAAKQSKENTPNKASAVPSARFDDGAKPTPSAEPAASPPPKPATPPRFLGTAASKEHGASVTAAFDQQKKPNGNGASSKSSSAGSEPAPEVKTTKLR